MLCHIYYVFVQNSFVASVKEVGNQTLQAKEMKHLALLSASQKLRQQGSVNRCAQGTNIGVHLGPLLLNVKNCSLLITETYENFII